MPKGKNDRTRSDPKDKGKKSVAESRANRVTKKDAAAKEEKEAARAATRLIQDVVVEPVGDRADRHLHIAFVSVGQGDCTMIKTPGGRVVMVDCGSTAWDDLSIVGMRNPDVDGVDDGRIDGRQTLAVRSIVRGQKFLRSGELDVLVLTHGDEDHHNLVQDVLGVTRVRCVYHSGKLSDYGTAAAYAHAHGTTVYRVTVNEDPVVKAHQVADAAEDDERQDRPLSATHVVASKGDPPPAGDPLLPAVVPEGVRILTEPHCTITVIASDVYLRYVKDKSDRQGKNRGSVVLLVEVGPSAAAGASAEAVAAAEAAKQKLLLSGDATLNTETFLLTVRGDLIKDVAVVHASHHGSASTSSSEAFVERVNPQQARISGPRRVAKHHLPSRVAVDRYVDQMSGGGRAVPVAAHPVWSWAGRAGSWECDAAEQKTWPIYTTGSQGTTFYTVEIPGGAG